MKCTKKWPIRVIIFCILVSLALAAISIPLNYPYDYHVYEYLKGLKEERKGALDVVIIGASQTYASWSPILAWENYGIASYCYGVASQHIEAYRYMIEEARKTQPDALYIISIGSPGLGIRTTEAHYLTDFMPPSLTRLRILHAYYKYNDYTISDKAELMFPLLRFHSVWDELTEEAFHKQPVFAKGAYRYPYFLGNTVNISELVSQYSERKEQKKELSAEQVEVLQDLLQYLKENQVQAMFQLTPVFSYSEDAFGEINTILDLAEKQGFQVLRSKNHLGEIGLDYTQDYWDRGHTNIHGAVKYTRFLAEYLLEQYHFTDKRGDPAYADFDAAMEEYLPVISPYLLDFETNNLPRTTDLAAPENLTAAQTESGNLLSWGPAAGADGYLVYRQSGLAGEEKTPWEKIGESDSGATKFLDSESESGDVNIYTVVPYRLEHEKPVYGMFSYAGVSVQAAEQAA